MSSLFDFGSGASVAAKTIGAAAVAFWGGLIPLVQLLAILMLLDIASGLLAAYYKRELCSEVSFRGMVKKGMVLLLVTGSGAIECYAGPSIGGVPLQALVAGFFCMHEGLSIIENAGRAGLPIPDTLRDALAKLGTGRPEAPPPTELQR